MVFLPMIMALAAWFIGKHSQKARNILASLTTAAELCLAVSIAFLPDLSSSLEGFAGLGISLETDDFRKIYLIVITFLWTMTMLFGNEYFSHYQNCDRYYFFNLMTLGAAVGVFLSADLFTALVFFEIMSFTSYTWVIQEETEKAIRAANTYLAVAVIGGLAALMGLFLLWHELGTTRISELYEAAEKCSNKGALYAAGGCILFGFGAKAGMFPLHIWLPKAHPVAPAPASALLSGLLTKTGIFGVLVLSVRIFYSDPLWGKLILSLGTVTMLLGALLALFSIDLKRTLACSSVSQIGFILVGIGMMGLLGEENALAARGTLLHMMNHSLFKLVLFSAAGVVYMNLHELDLNRIRGFGRKKIFLLIPFLLAALGIGGFPFLNGYVSKTLLHEGIVEYALHLEKSGVSAIWIRAVEWIFLFSGGLTVAYMTKLFTALFIERHPDHQEEFDAKGKYMNPVSTSVLCLSAMVLPVLGLTAGTTMNAIAETGMDFFRAASMEHAIRYLSWENLKGGLISIGIGMMVYFGFVRTVLIAKRNGRTEYIDLWPKWLDLEELLYRPLLLKWLPDILGKTAALFGENRISGPAAAFIFHRILSPLAALFGENRISRPGAVILFDKVLQPVSETFGENRITSKAAGTLFRTGKVLMHALSDSMDALILLIRTIFYRDIRESKEDPVRNSFSYRFGSMLDHAAAGHGRADSGSHRYAETAYRIRQTLRTAVRPITGGLSFALLILVLAIVSIFIYTLFL